MPTVHYLLINAYCTLATAKCLLYTVYCLMPTAHYLLINAYCTLATAKCLLHTIY